jgi:hypothetical protein
MAMNAMQCQNVAGAAGDVGTPPPDDRSATALTLITLSDDLQRLGYPYEAYQVREAAARLLRDDGP